MSSLVTQLDRAIRAAGIAIDGVSVEDPADKRTWHVNPASLQSAAQATIDAFDPAAAVVVNADLDAEVLQRMDLDRIFSAIVWCILDTYAQTTPATMAKYNIARSKIVAVYKSQPWKP